MDIAVSVLLALAAVAFVGYPLLMKWGLAATVPGEDERAEIEVEKESVYTAIKDLDFDYRTGKISDEDYQDLRERFKGEAVELMKQAEEDQGEQADPLEDEIEAARAVGKKSRDTGGSAKKTKGQAFCAHCGGSLKPKDKFCAGCGRPVGQAAETCPKCQTKYKKGDKFCQKCGAKL